METKKETRATIERKIKNALVFVPKDKDYIGVYYSDKGLRLEVTSEYCVISTGFHRHVFDAFNSGQGVSRPYLYTKRIIEITNENIDAIKTDDGYSFQKLLDVLKEKEDKAEYNIATYYQWWCSVIFDGLYSISEDEVSSWLVYFKYINIIATNSILLDEHKDDVTNKQFVERFLALIKEFTDNVDERVLFHALSDEERVKQEIEAIQEQEANDVMEAQADGNK